MRKLILFILMLLIVPASFGIEIYIKELSNEKDIATFESKTNSKFSAFGINKNKGAIYWVRYGGKDYIVWHPSLRDVYENVEEVKQALFGPYEIWAVENKERVISSKIACAVVTYILFELTPNLSSFNFTRRSNYAAWNFWKDYIQEYIDAYKEIKDKVIDTDKILFWLDISDVSLSMLFSLLTGGLGILGTINTAIELGDMVLTYQDMKNLYENIYNYSSAVAKSYYERMVQNNNTRKCEMEFGLESDFTKFLSDLEMVQEVSEVLVEAYRRIISVKVVKDLTTAFGSEWIKEALESEGSGFLTRKLKEAQQIIKSEKFEKSIILLLASFLKTDIRGAVKEGMSIALNSNALIAIGSSNSKLLDRIAASEIIMDTFDVNLITDFLTNMIVFEYIKARTIDGILKYGKPSGVNLVQRVFSGISALFKDKEVEEGLKKQIELSKREITLLLENLGYREYYTTPSSKSDTYGQKTGPSSNRVNESKSEKTEKTELYTLLVVVTTPITQVYDISEKDTYVILEGNGIRKEKYLGKLLSATPEQVIFKIPAGSYTLTVKWGNKVYHKSITVSGNLQVDFMINF
ncbi:MAG: hypothetical protein J7K13_03785 [Thermoplasmata archaeon]|nr:hypothetical protein [Thermoplasmata archaeon]